MLQQIVATGFGGGRRLSLADYVRGPAVTCGVTLAAIRTSNSAFAARYRRVMRHRGHKKAVTAVAHAMLVTAYHLLARQTTYQELGADYFDRRHAERLTRRLSRRWNDKATAWRSNGRPERDAPGSF